MAVRDSATRREMPTTLVEAIERGELTQAQWRELIAIEADDLGLGIDEAVQGARQGTLPKTGLGADIELLVALLDD